MDILWLAANRLHYAYSTDRGVHEVCYFTKILEVNLFAFAYRLFYEDFSPFYQALHDTQPISCYFLLQHGEVGLCFITA